MRNLACRRCEIFLANWKSLAAIPDLNSRRRRSVKESSLLAICSQAWCSRGGHECRGIRSIRRHRGASGRVGACLRAGQSIHQGSTRSGQARAGGQGEGNRRRSEAPAHRADDATRGCRESSDCVDTVGHQYSWCSTWTRSIGIGPDRTAVAAAQRHGHGAGQGETEVVAQVCFPAGSD